MSIKKDNISVTAVKYNNQDVNKIILNNNCVWCKPFTYTQGTLPTGVKSLVCRRSSTDEPTASTGEISNNGTIYYYDKLYWDATASAGYRITAVRGSGSPVTVLGAITGTTASGVTSERISGTISQGTLPTGVASITCYRKAYNGSSFAEYTESTIYYGDQFYWTATAATGYNNPSLTYNNSSKVYTWTGSQGGSINSVSASGLSAGTRKSFTISFGTSVNKTLYGSWSSSSQTAYYGDKITVSGTTVTCYKWDNNSATRWTVTVSAYPNDAQYTYSAPTIVESSSVTVTKAVTITAYNKRTLNSYTVTFSTTSGQYGSWSTASIANVSYGTAITRNGYTVTVGSRMNSSTFTPAPTTVQYNYASPTFSVPSSVTGATTVAGGCTRSDRLYTIQWIGADGSTVLETDSNVKYGDVLTYNGSTPSKASTAQYNYTFSAWKLGSTSGSTVTSGSTTNAGSTSSTTIKIYSTFTSTVRSYTITWSYLSAYPNTWTTDTQSYNYGATPSRTSPSTVTNTSNDERKVFTSWDNLNTVTGNRTITANYKTQFAPTIKSNYCEADRSSGTWYDSGTVITWTANDNYSFYGSKVKDTVTQTINLGGTYSATPGYVKCTISGTNCKADKSNGSILKAGTDVITWTGNTGTNSKYGFSNTNSNSTTDTAKVELGTTSYSKAAYYLWYNVTSVTGTHCSAYNSNSYTQGFSTGWHLSGTKIYWKTTEDPYAMTTSNETTWSVNVQAGSNNRSAVVKRYTLSLTKNANVSSIKAWRTKSPYQGAATSSSSSPLITSTGTATIYYGDSISLEARAVRYCYFSGDKTTLSINITATGNVTWSPEITRVTTFKVTIAAGTGVSSVYLSTDQNATSGSPSGTAFPAGTAVYAFAVLNTAGYTAPSEWKHVQGNIYRVGYAVMGYTGSPNFGTINATPSASTTYSLASGNPVTITLPSGTQMRVRNYGSKNDPHLYFSANFDLVVVADDCHWGSYELYGYPALATIYIYNHNGYEHGWTDGGDGYVEGQYIMDNYTPIGVIRYNTTNNSITVSAT